MDLMQRISDERSLIGCILADPAQIDKVREVIHEDMFVDTRLGNLYAFLKKQRDDPVDNIEYLRNQAVKNVGVLEMRRMQFECVDPGYAGFYAAELRSLSVHSAGEPTGEPDTAASLFEKFIERINGGIIQPTYQMPDPLNGVEIGPGLITVIGAGPGAGKTAFASQAAFGALDLDKSVTLTIANAEMTFDTLIGREIARRTSISTKSIRCADLNNSEKEQFARVSDDLRAVMSRIRWIHPPYTTMALKELLGKQPGILICDYLQKFCPHGVDVRSGIAEVMSTLRELATAGWGVIALSATSRSTTKTGSGHDGASLTMASFKDSAEIEFNADAAYLLRNLGECDGKPWLREIQLSCVKNRHGELEDRELFFNAAGMRFEAKNPVVTDWESGDVYDDMGELPF